MNENNIQNQINPYNNRNYGIDLLRILLAFMVLSLQFNAGGTGKVLMNTTVVPWKWIVSGVTTLCYPAVNCYVLISGFFMYKQKADLRKQVKSLSKLWLMVLFFSVIGYLCVAIVFVKETSCIELIKRFFPVSRGKWWFFTVYFAMSLLSPFINSMLDTLDKTYHRILILLLLVMCSVIPMFNNWEGQLGSNYGYSLLWFFVLYVTGAYLADNDNVVVNESNGNKFVCLGLTGGGYLVSSAIVFCSGPLLGRLGISIELTPYNSLLTYIQAITLLLFFMNIKIKKKFRKVIGSLSALSLASYMFHCQEDIESVLWSNLKPWEYANCPTIILVFLATIVTLFVVSVIIGFVRNKVARFIGLDIKIMGLVDSIYMKVVKILS